MLQWLPVTQHLQLWEQYAEFAREARVPQLTEMVYARVLTVDAGRVDELINHYMQQEQW